MSQPLQHGTGTVRSMRDNSISTAPARNCRGTLLCLFLGALLSTSSGAADWAQFRGPQRSGLSSETGLLRQWPQDGPPRLWRTEGIGRGYSSPVVAGTSVYVTGDIDADLVISALDRRDGSRRWKARNGAFWKGPYPGARGSCTVTGNRLYHMNAHGRVVCLDTASGRELWAVDVLKRFAGKNIHWGLSECLLVEDDLVVVTAGGDKAFLVALRADTGATAWAGPPLRFTRTVAFGGKPVDPPRPDVERAGYASPIAFTVGGRRLIAATGSRHYVIANAADGRLLWTKEVAARYEVIGAIPVWCGNGIVFAAPDVGTSLFSVSFEGDELLVEEVWHHASDNCHGAWVYAAGKLYGSGYRKYRPWTCIDARTGTGIRELKGLAIGSSLFADGCLYALSQRGVLALLEGVDERFVERGRLILAEKPGNDVWSHPVLADGHLFLRWRGVVNCYDVRAASAAP